MKRLYRYLFYGLFLIALSFYSGCNKPIEVQTDIQAVEEDDRIVYITETGTKYHVSGCRYLRTSKISVSLKRATTDYSACLVCKP